MDEMTQQLITQRGKFATELEQTEEASQKLRTRAEELRKKINAIDTLIGTDEQAEEVHAEDHPREDNAQLDGVFTPVKEYWRPILQSLVEMGGRGRREKVIESVGQKMKGILTPADYEMLADSPVIRWRNRVAWQASNMRSQGFIKKGSPRGLWEITDEGRKWLDDKNS
jgi:hypothetical protein